MLTPLPPYIASNMTDEEFQGLLDRSEVPAYVRERFEAFSLEKTWAQEDAEEARESLEKNEASERGDLDRYSDLVEKIREAWDTLAARLESVDHEIPEDETAVEKAITEAEDFNP